MTPVMPLSRRRTRRALISLGILMALTLCFSLFREPILYLLIGPIYRTPPGAFDGILGGYPRYLVRMWFRPESFFIDYPEPSEGKAHEAGQSPKKRKDFNTAEEG